MGNRKHHSSNVIEVLSDRFILRIPEYIRPYQDPAFAAGLRECLEELTIEALVTNASADALDAAIFRSAAGFEICGPSALTLVHSLDGDQDYVHDRLDHLRGPRLELELFDRRPKVIIDQELLAHQ